MSNNDDRTYIKVHDGISDHPKVDGLSDKAFRLLIDTWCWCSRHLTDGYVPQATWTKRGTKGTRRELVDAGLVIVRATGGVECHDYLSHQRSAHEVAELREKKRQAAAKGNHERWHVGPRGKPSKTCPYCPKDEDVPTEEPPPDQHEEAGQAEMFDPNGVAGAIAGGSEAERVTTSASTADRSPETEGLLRNPQTETDPLATRGGSGGSSSEPPPVNESKTPSRKRSDTPKRRSAREHGHRLPDGWWPSKQDQEWYRENCPNIAGEGKPLTLEFIGHWTNKPGKDGRKLDWSQAWQTWMRKENRVRGYRLSSKKQTPDVIAVAAQHVADMEAAEAAEESQGVLAPVYEITSRGA